MTNANQDTAEAPVNGFVMSHALYAKMKFLVQVLIPAISTLYFTLGAIWDFPNVEQVIGTLAALATFIGVLVGLSSRTYNASDAQFDGKLVVIQKDGGGTLYSLELNDDVDPENLDGKKALSFKVGQ